jgi:hypothetical protein
MGMEEQKTLTTGDLTNIRLSDHSILRTKDFKNMNF